MIAINRDTVRLSPSQPQFLSDSATENDRLLSPNRPLRFLYRHLPTRVRCKACEAAFDADLLVVRYDAGGQPHHNCCPRCGAHECCDIELEQLSDAELERIVRAKEVKPR